MKVGDKVVHIFYNPKHTKGIKTIIYGVIHEVDGNLIEIANPVCLYGTLKMGEAKYYSSHKIYNYSLEQDDIERILKLIFTKDFK